MGWFLDLNVERALKKTMMISKNSALGMEAASYDDPERDVGDTAHSPLAVH